MAAMKSSTTMFMIMFIVASMQMYSSMAQTRHVVGDALGWTVPQNGAATYTTWASQQTFNVGDSLFFNFTTGLHDVTEVSQAAYGPCTIANPISSTPTGPATITLTTAGTRYYICTVGAHCQLGQKLTINVSATTAAPPTTPPTTTPTPPPATVSPPTTTPSPAPAPSTTTTPPPTSSQAPSPVGATPPSPTTSGPSPSDRPTPSPASDTTPPPPSPSTAARSFTAVIPATLLAVAFAFFY